MRHVLPVLLLWVLSTCSANFRADRPSIQFPEKMSPVGPRRLAPNTFQALPAGRGAASLTDLPDLTGRYIVGVQAGAGAAGGRERAASVSQALASSLQVTTTHEFHIGRFHALLVEDVSVSVEELLQVEGVTFVEPDALVYVDQDYACTEQETGGSLWGQSRIVRRDALPDPADGLMYETSPNTDGSDVIAYIFDTGIRVTHEQFEGRATWGFTASAIKANESDADHHGHGTHVAGTVGGKDTGVAKKAQLVAVKVLAYNGAGSTSGLMEGFEWALADFEARQAAAGGKRPKVVINMSLGYGGVSYGADTAMGAIIEGGVTVVTSAGNSYLDACFFSPGRSSAAITVGSTHISDELSYFSNWGPCVDIMAPGSSILSAYKADDESYAIASGTSMASPHVAGVVARYLDSLDSSQSAPTPDEIRAALLSFATRDKINLADFVYNNYTYYETSTPNRMLYVDCLTMSGAERVGAGGWGVLLLAGVQLVRTLL